VADGLTVDSEGCLWIAYWDGWKVARYDPDGKLMTEIKMPVQRPTSCNFGGPDLNVLYITSASTELDLKEQPQAGDLFRIVTDVKGLPEPDTRRTFCEMGGSSWWIRRTIPLIGLLSEITRISGKLE